MEDKFIISIVGVVAIVGIFMILDGDISGYTTAESEVIKRVIITPFDAKSDEKIKSFVAVRHELGERFSAEVPVSAIGRIEKYGTVENAQILRILQPNFASGKGSKGRSSARSCVPNNQMPWGIAKVNGGSGGADVNVAVLDTGVNKNHLDLKNRIKQCRDFTKGPFAKNSCSDGNGHGTHVAGTIAADSGSDGKGIFGVAPQANLFAYKVCGSDGLCWSDDISAAIRHAADNNANVISMSFGGDSESSIIRDAITYAAVRGSLLVAAAGNDGPSFGSIDYPAANVNVIAVGAIDINENVPDFSSRGINDGDFIIEEQEVEFGAPGVSIESTWNDGCYNAISGTSMATPHISGLAAKLWQGSAYATRNYLDLLARSHDLYTAGDDPATGLGLPVAP